MADLIIPGNKGPDLVTENLGQTWSNMQKTAGAVGVINYNAKKTLPVIPRTAMTRMAQAKADMFRQAPNYYHPLYEGINLQLPTKTREINQWCRHFYKTDGVVGTAIDMHSELPLTGFTNVCDDPAIQKFFDIIAFDVLKLPNLLRDIALEYWKVGNCFPFGEWNEEYGIWTRFTLLNPDFVEVEKSLLIDNPIMKLDPDDNLKRIVMSRQPKELYEQLLKIEGGEVVRLIARGEKVPLDSNHVSHIAHKLSSYETVGTPLMFRIFKVLIYKDLIRRAQMAIAQTHVTPLKLVKVGSDTAPATPEAVTSLRDNMTEASNDLSSWFFTHHAVTAEYIASSGHVLPLQTEYDWIEKEMLSGLGINKAMLHGDGPNYATASVGYHVLVSRYLKFQAMLIDWVKNYVYKRVAQEQGFYRVDPVSGLKELIIPDVEFELMRLKEDTQLRTLYSGMVKSGLISKRTFYTTLGINYEKEQRQIQKEKLDEKKIKEIEKGKAKEDAPLELGPGGGAGGDMGGGGGPSTLEDMLTPGGGEGGEPEGGAPGGLGTTPPAPGVA